MNKFALSLLLLLTWNTTALAEPDYEIPLADQDYVLSHDAYAHQDLRVKQVKCHGREYGVLYSTIMGYSQGSRLIGVCAWEFHTSLKACREDVAPDTLDCYNKTVDFYHLESRHPHVGQVAPTIPDLDAEPAVAR